MKCVLLLLLLFVEQIQGSTEMIQKPTGRESTICFPKEKLPENSMVTWFCCVKMTVGTYFPNGETNVTQRFTGKVKLSGPTCLTFLDPQKSDSGVYFVKVIGDRSEEVKRFNITFQDQNTVTTVAASVSPAVSAALAVLVALSIAAAAVLWRYLKKKRQDQKEVVLFSGNSGTNSPNVRILFPPPQVNGDPHLIPESNRLMEENTGDSPV